MKVFHIKWIGEFSRKNLSVSISSMAVSVFKILEHSVLENSDHHWDGAEKSLLCPLNAKGLLDYPLLKALVLCVWVLVFTGRHCEYTDDIAILKGDKSSVFTESLPKALGSGLEIRKKGNIPLCHFVVTECITFRTCALHFCGTKLFFPHIQLQGFTRISA